MIDSARLSLAKVGMIPCPLRMSRRYERTLPRQLDLCSRGLLVANSVVATRTRVTFSSQTFGPHSLAATIHVSRRSRLHTTLMTYLSSQLASGVNSGTRKECVRYDGQHLGYICITYFVVESTHGPLDFTYIISQG